MLGAFIGRLIAIAILVSLIVGGAYGAGLVETFNLGLLLLVSVGVHLILPETKV